MGIDICYFLNHDLPTDTHEHLCNELRKRVNGKEVLFSNFDLEELPQNSEKADVWHVTSYPSYRKGFSLLYYDGIFSCEIELCKSACLLSEFEINHTNPFDYLRWNHMVNMFQDTPEKGKQWKNSMLDYLSRYIVPIVHSTKVLLTADSSSYRHETIGFDYILEQEKSIDEALEMNRLFSPPCKIWKNDEAFGRDYSDYWDKGDDFSGALFMFDVACKEK